MTESSCDQTVHHIADTVKAFRSTNKLSLDDLAKRSGVSRSMICQIEAGKVIPTIQVLSKMASGMNTSLTALIDGKGSSRQLKPVLISELDVANSLDGSFEYSVLNPSSLNRNTEVKRFRFKKKGERKQGPNPCGTTIVLVVEQGELELALQGEVVSLGEGQSLEFRAAREHSLRQTSKNYASGLMITSFG